MTSLIITDRSSRRKRFPTSSTRTVNSCTTLRSGIHLHIAGTIPSCSRLGNGCTITRALYSFYTTLNTPHEPGFQTGEHDDAWSNHLLLNLLPRNKQRLEQFQPKM